MPGWTLAAFFLVWLLLLTVGVIASDRPIQRDRPESLPVAPPVPVAASTNPPANFDG